MDVNTEAPEAPGDAARPGKLDGYTIHLLKADGTIATVGAKRRGGTVPLTVEVRDRKGERRIPVKVARNPRGAAFSKAVGEMKAELLRRAHDETPRKRTRPTH